MPGELPPTSAYTYAVEYSRRRGAARGDRVEFDKPVVTYVDNYLGFPAGTRGADGLLRPRARAVDRGAQRRRHRDPRRDGRPRRSSTSTATASPTPARSWPRLGIDDAELGKLADLYAAGQEPMAHADHALHAVGLQLALRAARRRGRSAISDGPDDGDPDGDDRCGASGSIILCETQTLGERYPSQARRTRWPTRRTACLAAHERRARDPADRTRAAGIARPGGSRHRCRWAHDQPVILARAEPSESFIFDGRDAYGRASRAASESMCASTTSIAPSIARLGSFADVIRVDRQRAAQREPRAPGDSVGRAGAASSVA